MLPLTAIVAMDVSQQGYAQVRAEERYRTGSDITTLESEINPLVRYDFVWKGGQNHFVALVQPRFVYTRSSDRAIPDANLVNPETLNRADPNATPFGYYFNGGFGYEQLRPRYRISFYTFAAYGPISTTTLLVQAPWTGEGPPPDPNPIIPSTIGARFTLVFFQPKLFVPIRLSPRTALIPNAEYNMFGGADRTSRGVIALTRGPALGLSLEHLATRNDQFISAVGVGQVNTLFQDGREGVTILRAEARQSWRHWFTPNFSTEFMGGGQIGGDEINGFTVFTVARAGVLYDSWQVAKIAPGAPLAAPPPGRGHRIQLGALAKVEPWIDLFSGDLEQRAVVSAAANYTINRVTFRGGVSQGRVINTPLSVAEYQIVLSEGSIQYRFAPSFSIDGGVRFGYQSFNNAVRFNELTQYTVYGGLLWAPFPNRF